MPIDHENSFDMARSVSFSTTLAEVTPYWEPALWVLIVVVTAGIVGSALWAPSRKGHRRRRTFFRRSDAKVRREERTAVAATMVPAVSSVPSTATSDFYPVPDFDEPDIDADDDQQVAVPAAATVATDSARAPELYDQASDHAAVPDAPAPVAPVAPQPATVEPVAVEPVAVEPEPVAAEPTPEPVVAHVDAAAVATPAPVAANGTSIAERPFEAVAEPAHAPGPVVFADVEAGFARLASDVAVLGDQVSFFDERSNVPPEMPTWPIEHQHSLAERAAEALADPLDELLEHSLAVASDVRALDRLLGGRFHDEESAQAIVGSRIDLDTLRRRHSRIHNRFAVLAGDFDVLTGTADQLAKVASIIDATDAVMGSWQPTMAEAARTVSARS
jgi:hypothetical protein